jgi:cytochrome c oxidase subunit IV
MSQHVIPLRTNLIVYTALMVLLLATVGAAYLPLGRFHLATAMTIAVVKTVMVMLIFMHLKFSSRLTWVFSSAAFVWLAILLVITLSDYLTRGELHIPGK